MAKNRFRGLPGGGRNLSQKRQDDLFNMIADQRDDAAMVALQIACAILNSEFGFGLERLDRFAKKVQEGYQEFYADREYKEVKLHEQLADIGFMIMGGRMYSWQDKDGNTVRAEKAEDQVLSQMKKEGIRKTDVDLMIAKRR